MVCVCVRACVCLSVCFSFSYSSPDDVADFRLAGIDTDILHWVKSLSRTHFMLLFSPYSISPPLLLFPSLLLPLLLHLLLLLLLLLFLFLLPSPPPTPSPPRKDRIIWWLVQVEAAREVVRKESVKSMYVVS